MTDPYAISADLEQQVAEQIRKIVLETINENDVDIDHLATAIYATGGWFEEFLGYPHWSMSLGCRILHALGLDLDISLTAIPGDGGNLTVRHALPHSNDRLGSQQ